MTASRQRTARPALCGVVPDEASRAAETIIFGCTEIMLLVRPEGSNVPLFCERQTV